MRTQFAWAVADGGEIETSTIAPKEHLAMIMWLTKTGRISAAGMTGDILRDPSGAPRPTQIKTWFDNHREGTDVGLIEVEIRPRYP